MSTRPERRKQDATAMRHPRAVPEAVARKSTIAARLLLNVAKIQHSVANRKRDVAALISIAAKMVTIVALLTQRMRKVSVALRKLFAAKRIRRAGAGVVARNPHGQTSLHVRRDHCNHSVVDPTTE